MLFYNNRKEENIMTFEAKVANVANYEDFVSLYEETLSNMFAYKIGQAGVKVFAEKIALLVDTYPAFEDRYDLEN